VETTVSSHALQPGRRAPRLPGLDLLRAVAIGWVMLCHANGFDLLPSDLFGWMGVDLFFVLSGFLIASQLLRPWTWGGKPNYGRFFARRLLRTLPAYLAVVAVYFAFPAVWDRDNLQPLWQFLTFTQNWLIDPTRSNSFSHAWSLCVEEQFYLIFPLVVVVMAPRATPRRILALVAAVLLVGMALRGWFWLHDVARQPFDISARPHGGAYMRLIYYPTWTRLDALLAGICAAMIRTFRPVLWRRLTGRPNLLLAVGVAGVAVSIVFFGNQIAGFWPSVFGFPLLALSMALMVMAATEPRSIIGRRAIPGAGALATGAYSLYLSHKLAYRAVINLTAHAPAWVQSMSFVLAILSALALGAALYWLVERPFLKLRDRLEGPSRSAMAGPLPSGSAVDVVP
jgi:peptidoglycan/LPS O-acetylase OafA/YrhL